MRQTAARLDIPGQPALLDQREGEPVSSRFTRKPLRRIRWTLEVYGDNAQEQLQAALGAASNGGEFIPDGQGSRWAVTSHSFSYQGSQAVTAYRHEVELAEHEDLRLERVEFEGLDVIPDRWKLDCDDHRAWLAFLVNLDPAQHELRRRRGALLSCPDGRHYKQSQQDAVRQMPVETGMSSLYGTGSGWSARVVTTRKRGYSTRSISPSWRGA